MTTLELSRTLNQRGIEFRLDPQFMDQLVDDRSQDDLESIGEEITTRPRQLVEIAVAMFKDAEETMGLARFTAMLDAISMGHSVDLMIWLRRWRAA